MAGVLVLQILVAMCVMAWYGSNVLKLLDNYFHSEFQKHLENEKEKLHRDHQKNHPIRESGSLFLKKKRQLDPSGHQPRKNTKTRKSDGDRNHVSNPYHDDDNHHQYQDQQEQHRYEPLEGGRDLNTEIIFKEFPEGNHEDQDRNKLLMAKKKSFDFSKETLVVVVESEDNDHAIDDTLGHHSQITDLSSHCSPLDIININHNNEIPFVHHKKKRDYFNHLNLNDEMDNPVHIQSDGQDEAPKESCGRMNKKEEETEQEPTTTTVEVEVRTMLTNGEDDDDEVDSENMRRQQKDDQIYEELLPQTSVFYSEVGAEACSTQSETTERTCTDTSKATIESYSQDQSQSIHFDKKELNLLQVEESALTEENGKNGEVNSDGFNFHFQQEDESTSTYKKTSYTATTAKKRHRRLTKEDA